MTEVLFILTTIFVAYVVYTVIGEQKTTAKTNIPEVALEHPRAVTEKEKIVAIKPIPVKTVAPKVAVTKVTSAKPAKKTTVAAAKSVGLRDPISGDVATAYSNYRFTKRWIKDALVAEGLLEKVYTASELNVETETKIKAAIEKLVAIDKYRV